LLKLEALTGKVIQRYKYNSYEYSDKWTKLGSHVGIWLGNN